MVKDKNHRNYDFLCYTDFYEIGVSTMGESGDYSWNDEKNALLLANPERGRNIFEVADAIFDGLHVEYTHPDYGEQSRAIGFSDGRLLTLAYELISQPFEIHLITYWPASREEGRIFERGINS